MLEYPDVAFDYVEKQTFVQKAIRYTIDHKLRKSVLVAPWVRAQILNPAPELQELDDSLQTSKYDTTMIRILKWVRANIIYTGDHKQWGILEKWSAAEETFRLGKGDCEDGAILAYVLGRLAGVPENRLYLFTGDVNTSKGKGGHCWLAYKPQTNPLVSCFLDWCYFYDSRSIQTRKQYYVLGNSISDTKYSTMWFCFNASNSFGSVGRRIE